MVVELPDKKHLIIEIKNWAMGCRHKCFNGIDSRKICLNRQVLLCM